MWQLQIIAKKSSLFAVFYCICNSQKPVCKKELTSESSWYQLSVYKCFILYLYNISVAISSLVLYTTNLSCSLLYFYNLRQCNSTCFQPRNSLCTGNNQCCQMLQRSHSWIWCKMILRVFYYIIFCIRIRSSQND